MPFGDQRGHGHSGAAQGDVFDFNAIFATGISPGNLYYHFRNKEEIIRELFERFSSANKVAFDLPTDALPTLSDLKRMVKANYTILWHYRFAHRELIALLQADAELHTRFLAGPQTRD